MSGVLYIISTPIGNPQDITLNGLNILKQVDIIACENLSTTKPKIEQLIGNFIAKEPLWLPYFDGNEQTQSLKIMAYLKQDKNVALISSAGTPVICDPGYKLVANAYRFNIPVLSIPGPCSVIAALSISGAKPFPFTFFGFFPKKSHDKILNHIISNEFTNIFFESSHRIVKTIEVLWEYLPRNNQIILIKDITKNYFQRIIVDENTLNNFNCLGEWVIIINKL